MLRTIVPACLVLVVTAAASAQGLKPDEALKRLKEGNARFVADELKEAKPPSKQRVSTAPKQKPIAIILTCADARSAPEYIFDKGLGVLFVCRVAGNVSGPAVLASLEYATTVLDSNLIVVLGHSNCGAVDAALKGKELPSPNLKHLVELVHVGGEKAKDKEAALAAAVRANVKHQQERLTKDSAILKELAASKRIKIVGGIYDLKTGKVEWLE